MSELNLGKYLEQLVFVRKDRTTIAENGDVAMSAVNFVGFFSEDQEKEIEEATSDHEGHLYEDCIEYTVYENAIVWADIRGMPVEDGWIYYTANPKCEGEVDWESMDASIRAWCSENI